MDTGYIAKADETINPVFPHKNELFASFGDKAVGYLIRRESGKVILVTSSGSLGTRWDVGYHVRLVADQSGRNLGTGEVIGHVTTLGLLTGKFVNQKVPHYVFK